MNPSLTYQHIVSNKLFFSGIAILSVCLSHLIRIDRATPYWQIFYPGFVGVDIFLFYSGYGLCRSWEKNRAAVFYVRRMRRVYPLLLLFTLLLYGTVFFVKHEHFTLFDVFCNLTTLNFWHIGGILIEWYMSFILCLYVLFPVLYRVVRRHGMWAVAVSLVLLFAFLFSYREGWLYQCAFSRVPIFLFGIMCYQRNEVGTYKAGMLLFLLALLLMSVLFGLNIVQKFELVYMSAPFVLFLAAWAARRVVEARNIVFRVFEFFGRYSLEIYLANMLILYIMPLQHFPLPVAMVYLVGHLVLVPMLISANRLVQRL